MNRLESRLQTSGRATNTHARPWATQWMPFAALPQRDLRMLCGFGAIGLLLIGLTGSWSIPGRCQTEPIAIAFGASIDASVEVPARRACTISVEIGSAVIKAVSIETSPAHGSLMLRGRTGVVYVPNSDFKGKDVFAFALDGVADLATGTSLVRVTATVK